MSFFDDIDDFFSGGADEAVPDVASLIGTTAGSDSGLSDLFSSGADALVDAGANSSWMDNLDVSGLLDSGADGLGGMFNNQDIDSVLSYAPTDDSYGLSNFMNVDGAGYDAASLDKLIAEATANQGTAPLDSFVGDSLYQPTEDLSRYLAPESELAALTDPVEQASRLQSAGVYGMSPDSGDSYVNNYVTGSTAPTGSAPAYMGTGSDSFNQYYDQQTGVVPTNAGIPLSSAGSWLKTLMARSGQGKKSNLASGIGAALMAAQIAGALKGNSGSDDEADNMTTAKQAKSAIKQTPATPMTWVTPGNKATGGPIRGSRPTAPQGALGLLRGMQPGQADKVPINASHGEYVMDADVVAALGDGNTDAGAAKLDKMRQNIRNHKRSAPAHKIPPKAKAPETYLKGRK